MHNLKAVFTFGWPYMRRYWGRLVLGILFGVLFGVSNGAFIWATGVITERLTPQSSTNLLSVRLAAEPSESIPLHISANTNVSLYTTNLIFSAQNWNQPQSISAKVKPKKTREGRFEEWLAKLNARVQQFIDPWLPIA